MFDRFVPYVATWLPRVARPFYPDMLWGRVSARSGQERVCYLTFDDGPTATMTDDLLRVLDRFEARATCFLIGAYARDDPARVRRIRDAGHTIGNHTFTHPDPWTTSDDVLTGQLDRTTDVLEALTGQSVRHLRPPYGHFTRAMRRWAARQAQRLVMWDVMPGDFLPSATRTSVERHVLRYVRPGSVVVLHDNPIAPMTPRALETILGRLARAGWRFDAL